MKNLWLRFSVVPQTALRTISVFGGVGFLLAAMPVHAQVACPADRPCITDLYISTTKALVANINGSNWDVINVRWSRPGREGAQRAFKGRNGLVEVLSGTTKGLVYTVSVQGCNKRVLQSSSCTDWDESRVKAGARPVGNY